MTATAPVPTTSPVRALGRVAVLLVIPMALVLVPLLAVGDRPRDVAMSAVVLYPTAVAGGAMWLMMRRGRASIGEAVALGVAAAILVPSALLMLTALRVPGWVAVAVLPMLAVITISIASLKRRALARSDWGWPVLLGGTISACVAVVLTRHWLELYQTSPRIDTSAFHPDIIALEAIVQANPADGLGQLGLMSDWPIRYHWLSYAWNGVIADVADTDAFFTVAQLGPMIAIVASALVVAALAARITSVRWAPLVAAAVVVCGRQVADSTALAVNWDSPSQLMSAVPVAVGAVLAVLAYRTGRVWLAGVALAVLSFVATGFKFSAGTVLMAGVVVAALLLWARRPAKRPTLAALAIGSLAGTAAFWFVFQRGEETGGLLELRSYPTADSVIGQVSASLGVLDVAAWRTLAILPAWAGLVFLLTRRTQRWRMAPLVAVGSVIAGLVPLWVFREGVPNATWFLASAAVLTAAPAVLGLALAAEWGAVPLRVSTRGLLVAGALASAVSALTWGLVVSRGPSRLLDWAPLTYLLVGAAVSLVAAVALRLVGRTTGGTARAFTAVLVAALGLSPLTMVLAQRAFPALPTDGYSVLRAGQVVAGESDAPTPAAPLTTFAYLTARQALESSLRAGSIVAFLDDGLLPPVLGARLRPYATREDWVALKGPAGTHAEFLRRRELITAALTPSGDLARLELCRAGVAAVIGVDDADTAPTPVVSRLTC